MPPQKLPNIAITGVPGTGKTTLATRLAAAIPGLTVLDMGAEAERRGCRDEYDEELQTWVVDEDKLVDALAPAIKTGGHIIDWIHADMWPSDGTLDLVVTLRADNAILYDRYAARGYAAPKVAQNLDAEIMNTVGEENADAFGAHATTTLVELVGNREADVEENVRRVRVWVEQWCRDQEA